MSDSFRARSMEYSAGAAGAAGMGHEMSDQNKGRQAASPKACIHIISILRPPIPCGILDGRLPIRERD